MNEQHYRNAELTLLPRAGHLPWLDDPDHVAGLVRGFLAARQPTSAQGEY